jgi:hypothetical protein
MPVVSTQKQLNAYQLAQQQKVASFQEQAAGYPNQSTGPLYGTGNTGFNLSNDVAQSPTSPTKPPSFSGDSADFLKSLYTSRPQFVQQQQDLLTQLGPSSRAAIFAASPELASTANYYQTAMSDPFGGNLQTYQEAIRGAQAARGFGVAGGTAPAGEEARYLLNYAAQQRERIAPQMAQFGQGLLNISGLGGPPDISLAALGGLALQNRTLNEVIKANQEASEQAKKMYQQQLNAGSGANPYGAKGTSGGGGTNPYGAGGSYSSAVGTGVASGGFSGAYSGGGGQDFFSQQSAQVSPTYVTPYTPAATDNLYALRLKYAQGLLGNVDPAKALGYI